MGEWLDEDGATLARVCDALLIEVEPEAQFVRYKPVTPATPGTFAARSVV
ncbi:MAG: hypothetical protein M3Y54_14850 [Bacteroidota bacterium]|nr:hypothetical protein [Bacteroidota bacterium]